MKSGAAGIVQPDHLSCGVDMFRTIGKIQAKIHACFHLEWRMALNGDPVFADIYDLVQIEHRAFGLDGEGGIRGRLDLVSHAPATVG